MTEGLLIPNWLDTLAGFHGEIKVHGQPLRTFAIFKKNEYPMALSKDTMPCVLVYAQDVDLSYARGGSRTAYWYGVSEFHLVSDLDRTAFATSQALFLAILQMFCKHQTLGGLVSYCGLAEKSSIQGPVTLEYGTEAPHIGAVAHWTVKEHINPSLLTFAD